MTTDGLYNNLTAQLVKIERHNRQGSIQTRRRYGEAMRRFCRFLADEYHLQNLRNIRSEHFETYIISMQQAGKSASTIKTDISAIRFYHDMIPDAKHQLPRNKELSVHLERRKFGGVDRSWSEAEYERFCKASAEAGHPEYVDAAALAFYAGLRIHECFKIDTAIADNAIRNESITIKGKGGKVRTVRLNSTAVNALAHARANVPRGEKLFVKPEQPTHVAIGDLQRFLLSIRGDIEDGDRESKLTFHGLRHSYAARMYTRMIGAGMREEDARREVSVLLGHNRPDVTRIYLAGAV